MNKENKTSQTTDPAIVVEPLLAPVNDVNSECYQCDAGMCHICSLKSNLDGFNEYIEPIINDEPKPEPLMTKKEILRCYMCGWEHHNQTEWNNYERATNGTLQKWCGRCGRISLLEKTISVPFNRC